MVATRLATWTGPNRDVHFFALRELVELFDGFEPVLPPRLSTTWREPPRRGQWSQWEAIWRRPQGDRP
jgi:hypothetical protein